MALWTPAAVAALRWWDVSDESTVIDTGLISQVSDLSGNAQPLTASGSNRPAVATVNSLNAADFSASTAIRLSAAAPASGQAFHAFYVQRKTSADAQYIVYSISPSFGLVAQSGSTSTQLSDGTGTPSFYVDAVLQSWSNRDAVYTALQNRTSVVEIRNGQHSASHTLSIGYYSNALTFSFSDLFGEMVIVPSTISSNNIERIQGYLHWKWGIESQLPAEHLYKSDAPLLPSVTLTIRDRAGTLRANATGLTVLFFDQATPSQIVAPVAVLTNQSTDGSGVLTVDIPGSTLTDGQIGHIWITNSDGTVSQHWAYSGPVAVSV